MGKTLCVTCVACLCASCLVATPTDGAPATAPARELVLDLSAEVKLKLALVPADKFLMGTSDEQRKAIVKALSDAGLAAERAAEFVKDEAPQHEVTISKPFYMGVTHVTVDQFAAFVAGAGHKTAAEKAGWSLNIDLGDGKVQARRGCVVAQARL